MLGMGCALLGACGEESAGDEDSGWRLGSMKLQISMGEDPCPVVTATVTLRSGDGRPTMGPLSLNVRDGVIEGVTLPYVYESSAWWVQVHAYDSNGNNVCSGDDPGTGVHEGRTTSVYIKMHCAFPNCP
ncbi:hypothetical protein D7Y27_18260 [Corallococcus sp. AB004]|nr:hypothetical protein D7Y04_01675 [Corallococcus sp. AB038B]RKI41603.1 hypothetical protein D7Y27_18260 [Corallococcus sp. AB004]